MSVPDFVAEDMKRFPLQYEELTAEQLEKYVVHVVSVLLGGISKYENIVNGGIS